MDVLLIIGNQILIFSEWWIATMCSLIRVSYTEMKGGHILIIYL